MRGEGEGRERGGRGEEGGASNPRLHGVEHHFCKHGQGNGGELVVQRTKHLQPLSKAHSCRGHFCGGLNSVPEP